MFVLLQQVVLGLLAVIIWGAPVFAAERVVAAIVDRVSGENITYREKDGDGAEQPLRLLTQLHTGDFVYLPESNDVIELLVGGSEHRSIVHRDSPYQVPSFGAPPSFLHNVFDGAVRSAIGSVEHLWGKEQEHVGRVPAIARGGITGGDLQAPIFSFAEQQVVAGDRAFSIGWEGGEPPYMVDIKREGNVEPIARQEGLSSPELYSTAIRLTPGRHKIVIRDQKSNHILQQTFEVVAAGKEPRPSNPSAFADLPPDLGTTLAAVWLAAQDNGAWALESLQRTSGLARSGYQPAVLLHNQLLYGGEAVKLLSGAQ